MENVFERYFNFVNNFQVSDIDRKLVELPGMTGHYQNIYFELKNKYQQYDMAIDRKWTEKYLYYKNEFEFTLSNTEIKQFIEKDLEMLDLKDKLQKVELMLQKSEDVLKGLDNFRWSIKSLVDWENFKAGNFK